MKLYVNGSGWVCRPGRFNDIEQNTAEVRVCFFESRWDSNLQARVKIAETVYITLHSTYKYVARRIAEARKGDVIVFNGVIRQGSNVHGSELYVQLEDAAVIAKSPELYEKQKERQNRTSDIPALPDMSRYEGIVLVEPAEEPAEKGNANRSQTKGAETVLGSGGPKGQDHADESKDKG